MLRVLFPILFISLLTPVGVEAFQVPEIPRPFLAGVAKTVVRRGNPVIYYNPYTIARMGPHAGEFVRAHEYAHLRLGHFRRNISPRVMEAEADLFAARNSSPRSVRAVQRWFMSGNGGGLIHGSSRARALRLSRGLSFQSRYRRVR